MLQLGLGLGLGTGNGYFISFFFFSCLKVTNIFVLLFWADLHLPSTDIQVATPCLVQSLEFNHDLDWLDM